MVKPQIGDRVQMLWMEEDPDPILPGDQGIVTNITKLNMFNELQLDVDWASGRRLMVILPVDKIMIIDRVKGDDEWESI